ncbi:MAG: glycosyltransferase family 2 protein [Fibrobacter sp.]|nr:glycosyltransferase family 2 protein [Fibrobacter sp.]
MINKNIRIRAGIVTYNSANHIEACLKSLYQQSIIPDIRVFDNASSDDTVNKIRKLFPEVTVNASSENLGFGKGHNFLLNDWDFDYYLLLNPDVELESKCLENLLREIQIKNERCGANPVVYYKQGSTLSKNVYSCGHIIYRDRRVEDLGIGQYDYKPQRNDLFGVNGACALLSAKALKSISYSDGPFDTDFFLYGEDDDLNWRLALAGWQSILADKAIAWHEAGASDGFRSYRVRVNSLSNRWLTILKNDHPILFLRNIFWIFSFELVYWVTRIIRRPFFICELLSAHVRFLCLAPKFIRKRSKTIRNISLKMESSLFEKGMADRIRILTDRLNKKSNHKSLWTKAENQKNVVNN